jgi:hypothetical protein
MRARDRFTVNQRVRLSAQGEKAFASRRGPRTGVVRGFGRMDFHVRVQCDGRKSVVTYHEIFWEPEGA